MSTTLAGGDWRGPASTLLCVSPSTLLEVEFNSQDYTCAWSVLIFFR